MTCTPINLGNGVTAIVCTRGERRHRCKECGSNATAQCDYPLRGRATGRTCSIYLCARCKVVSGELDYCRVHARIAEQGEQLALPGAGR